METLVNAAPHITLANADLSDPVLAGWYAKLVSQNHYFAHEDPPNEWVAIYVRGHIKAAYAPVYYSDGTVVITALVCEPSRAGHAAAIGLWRILSNMWKGRRIYFFTGIDNRKLRRHLPGFTNATPVATMFEMRP